MALIAWVEAGWQGWCAVLTALVFLCSCLYCYGVVMLCSVFYCLIKNVVKVVMFGFSVLSPLFVQGLT